MASRPFLLPFLLSCSLISPLNAAASCSAHGCQLLNPCSAAEECASGLFCGTCPASGKTQPSCTRGQATPPTDFVGGLPFNKYTWLVTHNSFSILNEPSSTGVQRITFYNQEDTVTNQLRHRKVIFIISCLIQGSEKVRQSLAPLKRS
ncbi:PI-PLC X domain-containing protein [Platanthera guangdongensis]|uniref:PI-PLC X domain-containing protein n=1 Tax=Platanthera guangdongensis TaxID=2320717 RepID=A0ABR2MMD1_9ASPA